jgi:hypothetical protein
MAKLIVKVEDLIAHFEFKRKINNNNLKDIVWTKDGKAIDVPAEAIKEFDYIGFNNIDLPRYYWKDFGLSKYKMSITTMTFSKAQGEHHE